MDLSNWKIKKTDKNTSGIDFDALNKQEAALIKAAKEKHGATSAYGYAVRKIKEKKYSLLNSF